jgi:hypothetical protein
VVMHFPRPFQLQFHDWYYIRKADNATAVPSAVQTYRDEVRTEAARLETAIAATTNITELRAIDLSDGWPEDLS